MNETKDWADNAAREVSAYIAVPSNEREAVIAAIFRKHAEPVLQEKKRQLDTFKTALQMSVTCIRHLAPQVMTLPSQRRELESIITDAEAVIALIRHIR